MTVNQSRKGHFRSPEWSVESRQVIALIPMGG